MIILVPVQGIDTTYFLERYESRESCESELERITKEMEDAYPGDTTYILRCRPVGKGI